MRFKEFLIERDLSDLQDLVAKVKANCKPFLKASGGQMLFRGISSWGVKGERMQQISNEHGRYTAHPADREPKDSARSPDFNFCFNAGCELAFDIQDIRKSTVFTTSHMKLAGIFGNLNLFFPVGEYKFLYSKSIHDSFESSSRFRDEIAENLGHWNVKNIRNTMSKVADQFRSEHEWLEGGPATVRKTADAFGIEVERADEFFDDLKDAMKSTYKYFYKNDQSLSAAIESENEILFYETHGYYVIPIKMFSQEMERRGIEHEKEPGVGDARIIKFAQDYFKGKVK